MSTKFSFNFAECQKTIISPNADENPLLSAQLAFSTASAADSTVTIDNVFIERATINDVEFPPITYKDALCVSFKPMLIDPYHQLSGVSLDNLQNLYAPIESLKSNLTPDARPYIYAQFSPYDRIQLYLYVLKNYMQSDAGSFKNYSSTIDATINKQLCSWRKAVSNTQQIELQLASHFENVSFIRSRQEIEHLSLDSSFQRGTLDKIANKKTRKSVNTRFGSGKFINNDLVYFFNNILKDKMSKVHVSTISSLLENGTPALKSIFSHYFDEMLLLSDTVFSPYNITKSNTIAQYIWPFSGLSTFLQQLKKIVSVNIYWKFYYSNTTTMTNIMFYSSAGRSWKLDHWDGWWHSEDWYKKGLFTVGQKNKTSLDYHGPIFSQQIVEPEEGVIVDNSPSTSYTEDGSISSFTLGHLCSSVVGNFSNTDGMISTESDRTNGIPAWYREVSVKESISQFEKLTAAEILALCDLDSDKHMSYSKMMSGIDYIFQQWLMSIQQYAVTYVFCHNNCHTNRVSINTITTKLVCVCGEWVPVTDKTSNDIIDVYNPNIPS